MGVCYIVGAAEAGPDFERSGGDLVIAADAGYLKLAAAGLRPDLAVGDFDSLGAPPEGVPFVCHPVMKDDTDMLLAVKLGFERGYREFRLYGGVGGARADHTVANLQTLLYIENRGGTGWLVGRGELMTAMSPGALRFRAGLKGDISVFAMGGRAEGVSLSGLLYPLSGAALEPDFPLGVSNSFTGAPASAELEKGRLLVIWSGSPADGLPERTREGSTDGGAR